MHSTHTSWTNRTDCAIRNERGMTMIELMVSLVISGILVTLIFQFFTSSTSSFAEHRQTAEMQQELRWAIDYVGERLKLAGNGVPTTSGWAVISNTDGVSDAPDSLSILGSFRSLLVNTTLTMSNQGSNVRVDNADDIEVGDLCVISDGTFAEIFMVTGIINNDLRHNTYLPWNDNGNLDRTYSVNSTVTVITSYSFYVQTTGDGRSNLVVESQAYNPQVLLGDVDDFQIRFHMKDDTWQDEVGTDEIYDIRMIEITINARSPEPIQGYTDPLSGDAYKRIEMKSVIIPKNITII